MADNRILLFSLDNALAQTLSRALPPSQYMVEHVRELQDVIPRAMETPPRFCLFDEKDAEGQWVEISQSMEEILDLVQVERLLLVRKQSTPGLVSLALQAGISEIIPRDMDPHLLILRLEALNLRYARCLRAISHRQDQAARRVGYSVEHYAGQPLTAVLGAAQMLRLMQSENRSLNDPEIAELIQILTRGAEDLSATIHKFANLKGYRLQHYIMNHELIDLENLEEAEEEEEDGIEMF